MAIKNISVGNNNFEAATSVGVDCGFLFSLTSYYEDEKKDVSETFIGIDEAQQIINVLQESIDFANSLKE